MPQLKTKEAIELIKLQIDRGTRDRLGQIAAESGQASKLAADPAALDTMPDISGLLAAAQAMTVELTDLKEKAQTGINNLASVVGQLGLADEIVFGVEEEPKPQNLIIDPFHKVVIRGEVVGRIPENSVGLQAAAILAGADSPLSQAEVAAEIKTAKGGRNKTGIKPHDLRSAIAKANRAMEERGLPELIVNQRGKRQGGGYILGPYQVLGIESPGAAEVPAAVSPSTKKGEPAKVYWGAQVAATAGIPTTVLEVLQEIGAFQPGVHFRVKERGETDKKLRVYTDEALKIARRVGEFAKKEGQKRFTERLIRDAVEVHEVPTENPFGENGPATFSPAIECRLLRTVKYCLPAIRATVGDDKFLTGQEQLLNARLEKLMSELGNERDSAILKLEKQIPDETEREKVIAQQARAETMLAAATAFDLINNRRPFNFLHKKHPGLDVVGDLIDGLKEKMPTLLEEFTHAVIELPTPVLETTPDRRVNGSILVGNLGHRKK